MSYCRWSTDDFQCDLYIYEDCAGGITTHIAGIRYAYKEPLPPAVDITKNIEGFWKRHQYVQGMIERADRVPIGLPLDGETFNDADAESCVKRIKYLREMGYRAPEGLEEWIMADEDLCKVSCGRVAVGNMEKSSIKSGENS